MMSFISTNVLLAAMLAPLSQAPTPDAREIVRRAIERAKADEGRAQLQPFVWRQRIKFAKLDPEGRPEEQANQLFEAALIDGKRQLRPLDEEGRLLADDQIEQSELAKRVRREQQKAKPGKKSEDALELTQEVADRFHWTVLGRQAVNGRDSYILSFLPRTDVKLPERKRVDKVVNRMQGRMWIDAEHYALLKAEAQLTEAASFFAGLGSLRRLDMAFEFTMIEPNIFAPQHVQMFVEGRRLFSSFRVQQATDYSHYRRTQQAANVAP